MHALAQVAHLELYTDSPPEPLRRKLNDELPADIHISRVDKAPHRFHARHDAVSRSYLYQISRRRTAFGKPFVWWIQEPLDVGAMREAAAAFVGMQDFEAFTDDDPAEKSTLRARGRARDRGSGRADPDPRPRLALPLEDGAPDGRRARRGRPRRDPDARATPTRLGSTPRR